jgi:hypothetical protein
MGELPEVGGQAQRRRDEVLDLPGGHGAGSGQGVDDGVVAANEWVL